jgi:hypothetical protein
MDMEPPMPAAPVPGAMSQPESQPPKAMEVDGTGGGDLTQEEQEQWDSLERTRAAELGREMAERLTAAKEEAAAKKDVDSPGKARTPCKERMARRATARSPYKKREDEEEDTPPLEAVIEEADAKKVPSETEEGQEEGEEAEEHQDTPEDGRSQDQ